MPLQVCLFAERVIDFHIEVERYAHESRLVYTWLDSQIGNGQRKINIQQPLFAGHKGLPGHWYHNTIQYDTGVILQHSRPGST